MNLSTYLKEIQKELTLTTFPSQNTVIAFTVFVVVFTSTMAVYLGALDLTFGEVVIQGINALKNSDVISGISASTTGATSTDLNSILTPTNIQISTSTATITQ